AHRVLGVLARCPTQTVPFLKEHLRPAEAPEARRLSRLLSDLDSERFEVREKATQDLEALGELVESAIRQTLEGQPSLEVRRRAEALLQRLEGPVTSPESLRLLRAVEVLEHCGTPDARRLLAALAEGAACRPTREAKAALARLTRRAEIRP